MAINTHDLIEDIKKLSKLFYEDTCVLETYKKYNPTFIIDCLIENQSQQENFKLIKRFISSILCHPKLFDEFLLSKVHDTHVVVALLRNHDERVRELVAECIDLYFYEFSKIIIKLYNEQEYDNMILLLQVLFHQLADPESEVGLKALRMTKKVFSLQQMQVNPELLSIVLSPLFSQMITTGLDIKDEVVQIRFMELVIELTNLDIIIQQSFINLGILSKALKFYESDDILVKLNAMEIMNLMGNSKWNAQYLSQSKFFKEILDNAMDEKLEFYERKYSVILYCKLISTRVIKLNNMSKLSQVFAQWFTSGVVEQVEAALEIFGNLAEISEVIKINFYYIQKGLKILVQSEVCLLNFFKLSNTTNHTLKCKFLSSFLGIFKIDPITPKQPNTIYYFYSMISAFAFIPLANFTLDVGVLNNSSQKIIKILQMPLSDIELIGLNLIKSLIGWTEILRSLISQDKFIKQILSYSQNKEIFDLKNLLVKDLLYICEQQEQEDIFKNFAKLLRQEIQDKNKQGDIMHVETQYQ